MERELRAIIAGSSAQRSRMDRCCELGFVSFRGQDFQFFDLGRRCKKVRGFSEQLLGDFSRQMSVSALLVGESIEDAKLCWSQFHCIPGRSAGFLKGEWPG